MTNITRELDLARDLLNKPLTPGIRARLQAVVDDPSPQNWENAYSIIVNPTVRTATLWHMVCEIDPEMAKACANRPDAEGKRRNLWRKVPDRNTLIQALQFATH